MRVRRAVAMLAAAFIVVAGLAVAAGAIERGDAVSLKPADGSQMSPPGSARFFLLKTKPGATINQTVRVINPNQHEDTVNLEAVDGDTRSETGAAYGTPGSPKARASRWVVISTPQITLQANEEREVPFTVHVPADLKPGQYLAGISASVPVADAKKKAAPKGGASFNLNLEMQRVVAVEVDIPGEMAPDLVVTGAEPKATPNGIQLGIHMANQGNAFAHGKGVISVRDTKTDYSFPLETFVPGTAIVYPMPWTKDVVPGLHTVQVDLSYEGGKRTTWNGTVNIVGQTQTDLENQLKSVTVSSGSSFNWWWVIGGLLLIAFIVGGIMFRRRNRHPGLVKYRTT